MFSGSVISMRRVNDGPGEPGPYKVWL